MDARMQRYEAAVNRYRAESGKEPDNYWQAFLWIATARGALWEQLAPGISWRHGEVEDFGNLIGITDREMALFDVARHLLTREGKIDLAELASMLDPDLWVEVLKGLQLYRGEQTDPGFLRRLANLEERRAT